MALPKKKTKDYYTFYDLVKAVNKELGYEQRSAHEHFDKEGMDFSTWHKAKGYPEEDSEGKHKGSSQIWFAEYQAEIAAGTIKKKAYMDFWHWQMDSCFSNEVSNDTHNVLYIGTDMDEFYGDSPNEWQLEIQSVYKKLFAEEAGDEYLEVYISW